MGETPTQTKDTTKDTTQGLWGQAIGGMIYGATYITSAIITGIGTAKEFEAREKEFDLKLKLQQEQWDAERAEREKLATQAFEQAQSGAGIAGATSTILMLGLLAGGLALVYKFA